MKQLHDIRGGWFGPLLFVALLLAWAPAARAEEVMVKVVEENLRATPSGAKLGTLLNTIRFPVLEKQTNWVRGEITFFIWGASVSDTAGNRAVVSVARENIRSAPPARVKIGTLVRGTVFDVVEKQGSWVKGKLAFWIWSPSVSPVIEANKLKAIEQYYAAMDHYEHGRFGLALRAANKAVEFEPVYPQAYFLMGLIHRARTDTALAMAAYRQTVKLNPDYAEAYVNMGNLALLTAEYDTAIELYREAIRHDSMLAQAYYNLAETCHALDRDTEAIHWYSQFAQLKPDQFLSYYNIACIYALQGNREPALDWFTRGAPYMGPAILDNALKDADLALLRDDAEFKAVIQRAREEQLRVRPRPPGVNR